MAQDAAGNRTVLETSFFSHDEYYKGSLVKIVEISVHNSGHSDTRPPDVSDLKISGAVSPGQSNSRLYIQATDWEAGLQPEIPCTGQENTFYSVNVPELKVDIEACGQLLSLGGGWVSVPFHVGAFVPPGKYFLKQFRLADRALNFVELSCESYEEGTFYSARINSFIHQSSVHTLAIDVNAFKSEGK